MKSEICFEQPCSKIRHLDIDMAPVISVPGAQRVDEDDTFAHPRLEKAYSLVSWEFGFHLMNLLEVELFRR